MLLESLKEWIVCNLMCPKTKKIISKRTTERWFNANDATFVRTEILNRTAFLEDGISLGKRIYCILNNITARKKCNYCEDSYTNLKYDSEITGWKFADFCSSKCANLSETTRSKIKSTSLKSYGVEHYTQTSEYKLKCEITCLEKYGVSNPFQSEVVQQKQRDVIISKYGVENISQLAETKEKKRQKSVEIYGTNCVFQSNVVKNKITKTNLEKYGVENPQQCAEISTRTILTRRKAEYERYKSSPAVQEIVEFLFDAEQYANGQNKLLDYRCVNCNVVFGWKRSRKVFMPRCPMCYPKMNSVSFRETTLLKFIETQVNYDVQTSNRTILDNRQELDIYIPELNIAFEFDGLYWHGEIFGGKSRTYHLEKTLQCEKLGIHLIHIFEDEWQFKQEIVKSEICRLLCSLDIQILATRISPLEDKYSDSFYQTNCLFFKPIDVVHYGIFADDDLVGCISINEHSEIIGFCQLLNTNVVNFWEFARAVASHVIFDRRWHFVKTPIISYPPNYFYVCNERRDIEKNDRNLLDRKRIVRYDDNLNEWENMQLNNIDRIWDCGKIKMEL